MGRKSDSSTSEEIAKVESIKLKLREMGIKLTDPLPRQPTLREEMNLEYLFETHAFSLLMSIFGISLGWDVSGYLDKRGSPPPFTEYP